MRKPLEALALLALAFCFWITYAALAGPHHLPDKIPTHYDLAGHPDAYGSTLTLGLLPAIALVLYLLLTAVSRYPAVFNYPVRVTPSNRQRLEHLALTLIAFLKAELLLLFAVVQYLTIQIVHQPGTSLPPALMPTGIAVIFLTIAACFIAMRRTASPPRRR